MNKNSKLKLLSEFATKDKIELYQHLYTSLPDPDKILCDNNYDYSILRDLLNDPHLMAAIQQRKMQVMQMGWEIECEGNEKLKNRAMDIMKEMPLSEVMNGTLNAILYGFAVGEIEWKIKDDEIIPKNIISKPQEWFIFNKDNELMMRKYANGAYVFEEGRKLPEYKFILSQYKPTYTNPYGEKILSRCYWPITFKRGGIEFWQLMMERFGMPYLIGRYAAGATEAEKEQLLDDLKQMIKDSISVFEVGKEIEIKESPQYDIGQLYEKLVEFHNKEIAKAVLTVTLTTEVERAGSYKAAEIHKEMLTYLGVTDKKLVEKALNKMFEYYTILNYGDIDYPRVKLNKKEAVADHSAERDKLLTDMGVKFTREYYRKRYNLADGDFEISET